MDRYLELRAGVVDLGEGVFFRDHDVVALTKLEVCLLRALAAAHRPLSRQELLQGVWSMAASTPTRAVEAAIHRLRLKLETDPTQPDHIQTVRGKGYRLEGVASPTSENVVAQSIALPRDGFVGRSMELVALHDALTRSRLVSVIGPPGVGKTRLVYELVRSSPEWTFLHVDGDLSPTRSDWLRSVGRHLGLSGVVLPESIGDQLMRVGPVVLWVDNLDALVESVATTLGRWLDLAPSLRVLVTSREALMVRGECVQPLEPLGLEEARHLFQMRSGDVPPDSLSTALDCLPLAIELACTWLPTLPLADLMERLNCSKEQPLTTDRRDVSKRHLSMRAALLLSWELLTPSCQAVLGAASAFSGTFSVPDLVEISGLSRGEVVSALRTLSQRSLVFRLGERSSLLRTTRRFARGQLTTRGAQVLERSHASYFVGQAEQARLVMDRQGSPEAFAYLRRVLPELEIGANRDLGTLSARCLALVYASRLMWGDTDAALKCINRALAACQPSDRGFRTELLVSRAQLYVIIGHSAAEQGTAEALSEAMAMDPSVCRISAHRVRSQWHRQMGDTTSARTQLQQARICANEIGDGFWGLVVQGDGLLIHGVGKSASEDERQEVVRLFERAMLGGYLGLADMLLVLVAAQYDAAEQVVEPDLIVLLQAALVRCEARGEHRNTIGVLLALGVSQMRRGEEAQAVPVLKRALALALQVARTRMEIRARVYLSRLDIPEVDLHRRIASYKARQLGDPALISLAAG